MFDFGGPELLIVLAIVILLFGPGRLSKILGEIGQGLSAFKKSLSSEEPAETQPVEVKIDTK